MLPIVQRLLQLIHQVESHPMGLSLNCFSDLLVMQKSAIKYSIGVVRLEKAVCLPSQNVFQLRVTDGSDVTNTFSSRPKLFTSSPTLISRHD